MMNVEDFAGYLSEEAYKKLADVLGISTIEVKAVEKNNGQIFNAVMPLKAGSRVSPTIYIDDLYKAYEGGKTIEKCVEELCGAIKEHICDGEHFDKVIEDFYNYDIIKDNLQICAVNTKMNEKLLETVPHVDVHDVSLVFRYVVNESDVAGTSSILVKNEHMDKWGVDSEIIFEDAKSSMDKNFHTSVRPLFQVIAEMSNNPELAVEMENDLDPVMYVITNEKLSYGAAEVFYKPEILAPLALSEGDLYIIPSSVHELIAVGVDAIEYDALKGLINEVNKAEVSPEEVLSDHPYYYSAKERTLSIEAPSKNEQDSVQAESEAQEVVRKPIRRH